MPGARPSMQGSGSSVGCQERPFYAVVPVKKASCAPGTGPGRMQRVATVGDGQADPQGRELPTAPRLANAWTAVSSILSDGKLCRAASMGDFEGQEGRRRAGYSERLNPRQRATLRRRRSGVRGCTGLLLALPFGRRFAVVSTRCAGG